MTQSSKISKSLKSLSNFSNKTSKLMKLQYEQNPYPMEICSKTGSKIKTLKLTKTELNKNYFKHEILIAGSGMVVK